MTASNPTGSPASPAKLTRWQIITIIMLTLGYAGYYLCRVHLSICTSSMIEDKDLHLTKKLIGGISSFGLLFYAGGKFVLGSGADLLGGKRMFLLGMGGAVLCTVLFGLSGGLPMFTLFWAINRAVQSGGWAAIVKISSKWFSYSVYGTIMGIISLSYLFGDFAARLFLGVMLGRLDNAHNPTAWRTIFMISAGLLSLIFVGCAMLLKETPAEVGDPEPVANPDNVYREEEAEDAPSGGPLGLLLPLLTNPTFWMVCILSFGFTVVRETFNNWIPTYLHEVSGMDKGTAGEWSSIFPLVGGFSVLACGFLSEKMGRLGRARIIIGGLLISTPALFWLARANFGKDATMPLIAFGVIAFVMLGPYSFLAGAIGMDFGGKKGSATASGWIDGVGYIGGMLAGAYIGGLSEKPAGWGGAFQVLAVISAITTVAAFGYLFLKASSDRRLQSAA